MNEVKVYVTGDDYESLDLMSQVVGVDIEQFAIQAICFYVPLLKTLKDGYVIQLGPNPKHTLPYLIPEITSNSNENNQISPLLDNVDEDDCISIVLSQKVTNQLKRESPNLGQFILDSMVCYYHLIESRNNGNRIFLEKDGLIESEVIIGETIVSLDKQSFGVPTLSEAA
jgi:hypothetical protein